jgi:hypothetical protein
MTIKSTKAINYTDEQTTKMMADYVAGVTVDIIATELGKTVRSVIAKLSREKVYTAKVRTTKTGTAIVKKDTTADAIGALLGMTEAEIESMTKANKTALVKVLSSLQMAIRDELTDEQDIATEQDLADADALDDETFAYLADVVTE